AWCITCDNQVVETQGHLSTCKGYEANWCKIESQVFQLLWNSLEQNLQKKILSDKLMKWLYGKIQKQKKAIREEIIRNLTRRKTEQTLLEATSTYPVVRPIVEFILQKYMKAKKQKSYHLGKGIDIEKKAKWKSKTRLKTGKNRKIPKKEE
ncbi:7445_t:CDS:2, partial [Gigaspora margarita]